MLQMNRYMTATRIWLLALFFNTLAFVIVLPGVMPDGSNILPVAALIFGLSALYSLPGWLLLLFFGLVAQRLRVNPVPLLLCWLAAAMCCATGTSLVYLPGFDMMQYCVIPPGAAMLSVLLQHRFITRHCSSKKKSGISISIKTII